MDSIKDALMQRKAKGGLSVTLQIGKDGSVQVESVEKLDSEAPPPAEEQVNGDEEGGAENSDDTDGSDGAFPPMDEQELGALKAKSRPSLTESARMDAAMRSKMAKR